jgi:transposase
MSRTRDTNIKRYNDRIRCITYREQGNSIRWIANKLKRSKTFVSKWCRRSIDDCHTVFSPGRDKILTNESKRIIRNSRNKRGGSTRKLRDRIKNIQNVSHQTIWRFQHSENVKPHTRGKQPLFTKKHIKDRKDFANEFVHWTEDDWENVVFTDETDFTLSERQNQGRDFIWSDNVENVENIQRPVNETKYMIHSGFTSKGVLKIIWIGKERLNAIDYQNKCLVPHLSDINSRNRYNVDISKTKLFDDNTDWTWLQDGASAHTARSTQQWLEDSVPDFIEKNWWPGNSPDLNPIENLWSILKRGVYARGGFRTYRSLKARVEKCWREISRETLENLAHSMVKRCKLLKRNSGKKLPY